jgi:hypothetical protein
MITMIRKIQEERGIALVTTILLLLAFTVLGVAAINISNVGTKITSNTRTTKQAFYLAEAGAERARDYLRNQLITSGSNSATVLNAVTGTDGVLNTADDVRYITNTSLGAGSYQVYLTNLTNVGYLFTATFKSYGNGPDNSLAVIQTSVNLTRSGGPINLPNLPGAITLAGPNCVFGAPNSNADLIIGGATHPAVAVNSVNSYNTVTGNDSVQKRADNYTGIGGTPSVTNTVFGSPWDSISDLNNLYTTLKANADYYVGPTDPDPASIGSTGDRKVVVVDRDFTLNPTTGAGILLVTGQLTLSGNFSYDGIILVIGSGNILRNGGGNGTITGGIYAANIKGPDGQINTGDDLFGNPTFDTNGGGNSTITYNGVSQTAGANLTNNYPYTATTTRTSWQQL